MATTVYHEYQPKGACRELFVSTDVEVLLDGPANTGKSRACGEYLYNLAERNPGCRLLAARKTRRSLSESFQVTFEELVLPPYHPALGVGGVRRQNRHAYTWPNKAILVLGGLDEPTRYYSTEWDVVFIEEAHEVSLEEWQKFLRALRYKHVPHPTKKGEHLHRLIGATNPAEPTHWLNQRCNAGAVRRLTTKHADNPIFTPADQANLDALVGVTRLRLRDGKWVAAEGQIWGGFSPDVHVLSEQRAVDMGYEGRWWKYTLFAQDWGVRKPGCLQIWGVDYDGRMVMIREYYHAEREIDWWIDIAVDAARLFRPVRVVCDPADRNCCKLYRRAGLPVLSADKLDVVSSVGQVGDRLKLGRDQRPRIMFMADAPQVRDPELARKYQPCSTVEEIPQYTWHKPTPSGAIIQEPSPTCADHGCDAARYAVRYVDAAGDPSSAIVESDRYDVVDRESRSRMEAARPRELDILEGRRADKGSESITWPWS
jgi:phage terminase large subunit